MLKILLLLIIFQSQTFAKIGWNYKLCLKNYGKVKEKELKVVGKYSSATFDIGELFIQYTFYENKAIMIVLAKKKGLYDEKSAIAVSKLLLNDKPKWVKSEIMKNCYFSERFRMVIFDQSMVLSIKDLPEDIDENLSKLR